MNWENMPSGEVKKIEVREGEKKASLYPERPFLRVNEEIERLKMIEKGEIKKLELNESEREEILEYEKSLGEELEKIDNIKINSKNFYLTYFLTKDGQDDFFEKTGLKITGDTEDEIEKLFNENRAIFDKVEGKKLTELAGKSVAYNDEQLIEALKKQIQGDSELNIDGLKNPSRLSVVLNPTEAYEKIKKLRLFKRKISLEDKEAKKDQNNVSIGQQKIRDLYRKKVNVMIVDQVANGIWANELANSLGEDQLTQEERALKETVPGLLKFEEVFSRYDRFIYGADAQYDENGMRRQIGYDLNEYANEIEKKYIYNQVKKDELIKYKGLDPEKIKEKNIDKEKFSLWAEKSLEFYGEKSQFSAEEYDPKRVGPAPDNKWQFISRDEYQSMEVNKKQKVIKSGTKNKTITEVMGTLLGHEFTHFIQAKNKEKIPLKLFGDKLSGFRSVVFAEGGAMEVENEVDKELFGFENTAHPHYIRAMARKIEGGDYLNCVKAFYDSGLNVIKEKIKLGLIDQDGIQKETKNLMTLAVNRARRLFADGDKLNRSGKYLTKSKDTVYAEQVIVMNKLKENGLENCAFVSGINLDTLASLAEIGLIDLEKIEKPNLELIRDIWQKEKGQYEIN